MAVVRNLMIRIGADYSAARKSMQGATQELGRFRRDTERATQRISGSRGLGGISAEFKSLGSSVASSLSQIRGAKGLGGVTVGLAAMAPALGRVTTAMGTMAAASGGLARALGPVGLGIGVIVTAAGLATAAIAQASQEAVKFEATLGRLNMQLKGGSRDFMEWARAQGLAKQTAADLGATYGTLLSSFIRDNQDLAEQTKALTQATRVTASATGRSIEDVLERMRSGLLGNTEAIEDLGIFVNVSMIESTKAFRRFAGDKSWEQLSFQTQQQIRLAAILEQSYNRYGSELQNNVMTKQTLLVEQFKDIKLNLSQAFLPIWDAVLPALTALAENVAYVTEQLARFSYWLSGKDYDSETKGLEDTGKAAEDVGNKYEETGKQAAKARSELAAFDRLNLLGSGSGIGSGGKGGGSGGVGAGGAGGDDGSDNWQMPEIPTFPVFRLRFEPPIPPDAGVGAAALSAAAAMEVLQVQVTQKMATMWQQVQTQAQIGTLAVQAVFAQMALNLSAVQVPGLSSAVLFAWGDMWAQIQTQAQAGTLGIQTVLEQLRVNVTGKILPAFATATQLAWNAMWGGVTAQTSAGTAAVSGAWSGMLSGMAATLAATQPALTAGLAAIGAALVALGNPIETAKASWKSMLSDMQQQLNTYRPYLEWGVHLIAVAIRGLEQPEIDAASSWKSMLSSFQQQLNAYRPYLEYGIKLIAIAVRSIESPLAAVKSAWDSAWNAMSSAASKAVNSITSAIDKLFSSWESLLGLFGVRNAGSKKPPSTGGGGAKTIDPAASSSVPKTAGNSRGNVAATSIFPNYAAGFGAIGGMLKEDLDQLQRATEPFANFAGQFYVPGGWASGAANIGKSAAAGASKGAAALAEWLKGLGIAVPAFASGGLAYGPTLAMVGDNVGARTNPELIAPLSDVEDMIGGADNGEIVSVLRAILRATQEGRTVQAVISRDAVGQASADYINEQYRRGVNPLPSL